MKTILLLIIYFALCSNCLRAMQAKQADSTVGKDASPLSPLWISPELYEQSSVNSLWGGVRELDEAETGIEEEEAPKIPHEFRQRVINPNKSSG